MYIYDTLGGRKALFILSNAPLQVVGGKPVFILMMDGTGWDAVSTFSFHTKFLTMFLMPGGGK